MSPVQMSANMLPPWLALAEQDAGRKDDLHEVERHGLVVGA